MKTRGIFKFDEIQRTTFLLMVMIYSTDFKEDKCHALDFVLYYKDFLSEL